MSSPQHRNGSALRSIRPGVVLWVSLSAGILLIFITYALVPSTRRNESLTGVEPKPPGPDVRQPAGPVHDVTRTPTAWRIEEGSSNRPMYSITVTFGDIALSPVGTGSVVRMEGQAGPIQEGGPDLPSFARLFPGIPAHAAKVRVVAVEFFSEDIRVDVAPVAVRETFAPTLTSSVTRTVRRPAPEIYTHDTFWPDPPAAAQEAWMGPKKLVRLVLYPVQYNPLQHRLRRIREIQVTLTFMPTPGEESTRGPI